MPRCYTKSGSIEKYESAQWSTPVWSGATGSITGPDSKGNYTVNAPSDYSTTVTSFTTATCTTNYAGVTATFTFYKEIWPTVSVNIPSVGSSSSPVQTTVGFISDGNDTISVILELMCKYQNLLNINYENYTASVTLNAGELKTVTFVRKELISKDVTVYPEKWISISLSNDKTSSGKTIKIDADGLAILH